MMYLAASEEQWRGQARRLYYGHNRENFRARECVQSAIGSK